MMPSIEELADSWAGNLFSVAFNICGNIQDAEDAVQETFVAYLTQKKTFESWEHLKAWMIRVTINKARNKTRSFWRKNKVSLEEYMTTATFPDEESASLFEAVMALPEKLRIVIHLYYFEGYSVKEISRILKLTENNVKVRLVRGRSALRKFLEEELDDDGP